VGAPTGTTSVAAVIGSPVRHSRSPAIHNAAFAAAGLDWVYLAFEVTKEVAVTAVRGAAALGVRGLSVTMPLKEAVIGAVDELSATAAALGAVNTLTMAGGRIRGDNTDGAGLVRALGAAGAAATGRTVAVLGAGGAARAAALALAGAGASAVIVVNRDPGRAEVAASLAGVVGRVGRPRDVGLADLVVHATPVGMAGGMAEGQLPIGADQLHSGQTVVDLVYHPLRTPLLAAATAAGATTLDGLGMLVHQAALQFEAWTGVKAPVEAMDRAAREA